MVNYNIQQLRSIAFDKESISSRWLIVLYKKFVFSSCMTASERNEEGGMFEILIAQDDKISRKLAAKFVSDLRSLLF